ncbi:hypothetical protein [Aliikangiella maris]|uniref:Lysine transporter LysE n=2 Tax=Aliikangiella maris TaxID=3162458 RepID=A0ABV3MSV9_9GAMM
MILNGIVFNILGLGSLFFIWKKNKKANLSNMVHCLGLIIGWGLVCVSTYYWISFSGVEFGLSFACLNLTLSAWLYILFSLKETSNNKKPEKKPSSQAVQSKQNKTPLSLKTLISGLLDFLVIGPLALFTSCVLSLILFKVLPFDQANTLVLSAFTLPLFWAFFAYWGCMQQNKRVRFFWITCSGLLGSLLLLLS